MLKPSGVRAALVSTIVSSLGLATAVRAQLAPPDPTPHPFSITRSDPALDQLIVPDAKATLYRLRYGRPGVWRAR